MNTNFILVDDDFINNLICQKIINKVFPHADVKAFTNPESGLLHIQTNFSGKDMPDTILFLDINMPSLSGWEFLEAFEKFDNQVKENIKIYMLSSSLNHLDIELAEQNNNVLSYIRKPLTRESLENVMHQSSR